MMECADALASKRWECVVRPLLLNMAVVSDQGSVLWQVDGDVLCTDDPKKVKDREESGQPPGHIRSNFQLGIFELKRYVSEPV